ncbi:LysR family transcriptional regulator [Amycolatopsis mediterranei S699]|uniref:LysR family transcriptional regulator n=2 Tax=Amycolatopsis mediterranei TaxID=33910 RepID=A0A0H3DFG8_AMYMU|nr:LysR substrate-binding domain-containing protein [Amycolatopsis mediterranei]ADJ48957.1 LysR family transcriptional regulator [Amycolatopsis mediterranei U32]AEK45905.1 LysR family transcriptional regulator [Amycolatopsis mediterranei S699]AFO80665.1 LysR family transcriptional regulator [Amycolatopsis mediterranei S699]AGT87793.1 LysR family transcriptional regulator [Amycolatopsis mediterranei RB]KDU93925.1 LysR family transcriptional regulator [Amycolatopsis mediterranei]
MIGFTLRQLEYFAAVAASGSLAEAAEQLTVSRSALAAGIDALETAVGTELLHRQRAVGVSLTPAGEEFLDGALSLLRSAGNLHRRTTRQALGGVLNIGAAATLAPVAFPGAIDRLAGEHPGLRIRVAVRPADELVTLLHDGSLELIANYSAHRDRSLDTLTLFETTLSVILAAGHRLAERDQIAAAELAEEPVILIDNPQNREVMMHYLAANGISPDIRYRVDSVELCRALVARNVGISFTAVLPQHRLSHESRTLVSRPLTPRPISVRASLAWPRDRALSDAAQAFIDAARREATITAHSAD